MTRNGSGRPWWVVFAVVVAAVLVGAAVLVANHAGGDDASSPSTADSTGATPTNTAASTTGGASDACPAFPDSPTEVPTTAPSATWTERGFFTLPVSTSSPSGDSADGPAVIAASKALACFAHTPTGALFAAVASTSDALDPAVLLDWARHRVTGPGQAAAIEGASLVSPTAPSDGRTGHLAGFRIDDCGDTDRCVIDIAATFTLSDGTVATTVTTSVMVWTDGDWRTFNDGKAHQTRYVDASDLAQKGFTPWSP